MLASKNQNHIGLPIGLILALVGLIGAVVLVPAPSRRASAQAAASWAYTGSLNFPRANHTATLLPGGKVLVAGGDNSVGSHTNVLNSTEIYDPVSGTWSFTGSLNTARYVHTATLLPNGKVLVAGGFLDGSALNSAELYDPATGTWTNTGNLNDARSGHTATLLPNGKVLVAGGTNTCTIFGCPPRTSAELYDPTTETWSYTGSPNDPRIGPTMTLLQDGKVLVIGGNKSTELYDAATGTWSRTGNLNTARGGNSATLLPNGKVLVAGGVSCPPNCDETSAELYDPATATWNIIGGDEDPWGPATLLPSGKVLVGSGGGAELYDPVAGTWSITASPNTSRYGPATLLANGKVLVAGGLTCDFPNGCSANNSAELYDPGTTPEATPTPTPTPTATPTPTPTPAPTPTATPTPTSTPAAATWTITGNLNTGRDSHTATRLLNGKVLVAGGNDSNGTLKSAELYDPATGTWTVTGSLNTSRAFHTATLLLNGKVLVAGGFSCGPPPQVCSDLSSAELYDPSTETWSNTGDLPGARESHTATLLANGKVLVVGDLGIFSFDAELYDPATGTWSNTGSLNEGRGGHTATLLPGGKVLVVGGRTLDGEGGAYTNNTSELYDPGTGTWSYTANTSTHPRAIHTATLLPNGNVLVAGGFVNVDTGQATNSGELFNALGSAGATVNLNTGRAYHTATLLAAGKVLVAGGFFVDGLPNITNSAELYDSATGTWSNTAPLNVRRRFHTATLLLNGKVLAAGGNIGGSTATSSAELYDTHTNQIDDAQFFVHQHYLDFLNREPDQSGWDYWTSQITLCGGDAACIHRKRIDVSAAYFIELEFQETGYFVYRFYKATFGRQPNYAEFSSDRSKVIGGSNLEASKRAFADEWVQRAVFLAAYPNTMSNTEVVNKLFDSAGLTASRFDAQRQQEIAAMNAGRSRALVLRDVIEIPDFKNIPNPNDPRYAEIKLTSQYNPAFVLMQYFGYLHRDLDRSGYDFWLDVVNNREPNNYRGMVCSFITSSEYQLRFGSVVTRSNADCGQ